VLLSLSVLITVYISVCYRLSVSVSVYMYEPRYVLKHSRARFPFHVLHSTKLHYVSSIIGSKDGGNVGYILC